MKCFLQTLISLCLLGSLIEATVPANPYCDFNETKIELRTVTKTRVIYKKNKFKFWAKPRPFPETYDDQEEHVSWKLVSRCCQGYAMSELKICEPVCAQSCPENAYCVEPNRCHCRQGYVSAISPKDGKHFCEPICESACPENARCMAPNECECKRGYRAEHDQCVVHCSSGCPHEGMCIHPEVCICQEGYRAVAGTCEPETDNSTENSRSVVTDFVTSADGTELMVAYDSDDWNENDNDLDDNEKIFLSTPKVTSEDFSGSGEDTTDTCAPDYQYYNGDCRPKVFASNEVDCRFKPCTENANCQSTGVCACDEGYIWHTFFIDETTEGSGEGETATVANAAIRKCITLEEFSEIISSTEAKEIGLQSSNEWLTALYITLGVACVLSIFIVLVIKIIRRQRGNMNVQAKNDLCCEYESKHGHATHMVC